MMKLIDIARMANVSKATASRALADSSLVKDSTKKLIKQIAKDHNYRPNTLAQAVAKKRSGILGFCLLKKQHPSFGHPFFGPVLDGALEQAKQDGYHLILAANSGNNHAFDEPFLKDCIEGVILSSFAPLEAIKEFKKRNIPQVIINDVLYTEHNTFIMDENYEGAYGLMEHLIRDKGHKKIALITDRLSHTSYLLRYFAYINAHRNYQVPVYENSSFANNDLYGGFDLTCDIYLKQYGYSDIPRFGTPIVVTGINSQTGYKATSTMIKTGNIPDSIFATTDSLAIGVIQALQDAGLQVPKDVAVVGYDDVDIATAIKPHLTTVSVNKKEIGRIAVRELGKLIANPERESSIVYVKNRLALREST